MSTDPRTRTAGEPEPRLPFRRAVVIWTLFGVVGAVSVMAAAQWPGQPARGVIFNVIGVLAPLVGAGAALAAARGGDARRSWLALAAGQFGWAAGQAIWTYFEHVAHWALPFPSWADAGYLLFPAFATIAVLLIPSSPHGRHGVVLDGVVVATAVALVSWSYVLPAVSASAQAPLASAISLAYPITDIVVLTMAVMLFRRAPAGRTSMVLLAGGLATMTVADSAFAYAVAKGSYRAGGVVDIPFVAAFALLAAAAMTSSHGSPTSAPRNSPIRVHALPYGVLAIAIVAVLAGPVRSGRLTLAMGTVTAALVALVLARQFVVLAENRALVRDLACTEERLRRQAYEDPLTGLPNRARVVELLRDPSNPLAGAAFVDIDDFKDVNDSLGHAAGDELLRQAGERIRGLVRAGDVVARLGGDEFAVLFAAGSIGSITAMARRLLAVIGTPFVIGSEVVQVSASIGVALDGLADANPDEAVRRADLAMYEAKAAGKGRFAVFDKAMSEAFLTRTRVHSELGAAIRNDELRVVYQPIVALATHETVGAEALVRWAHPERGLLSPAEFIPVAERSDLIVEVGEWVLTEACLQAATWRDLAVAAGRPPLTVSVNVSARQLDRPDFARRVADAIAGARIEPGLLTLEVTETAVMAKPERARQALADLRALGVGVAIDDFGTGYASLTYLKNLSATGVKIDRTFVDGLGTQIEDTTIVAAVIGLAHALDLTVTAEGVETAEQLLLLDDMGCQFGQGYHFARPVAAAAFEPGRLAWRERVGERPVRAGADPGGTGAVPPVPPDLASLLEPAAAASTTYRVVIADDNADDRLLTRRGLEASGRFVVVGEAVDGLDAVRLASARQPHVVLLDLRMPTVDGLAALPRILLAAPGVQVVLVSGAATPGAVDRALSIGAAGFFDKGIPDLARELLNLLAARRGPTPMRVTP